MGNDTYRNSAASKKCSQCELGILKRRFWGYGCSSCGAREKAMLTRFGEIAEVAYIVVALAALHFGVLFMGTYWYLFVFALMAGGLLLRYLMSKPAR